MSGLDNPRGLAFGPEGALYVAEAGRGGPGPCILLPRGVLECYGATGAVSRLWRGAQERVATGLPSRAGPTGEASGVHDIDFLGRGAGTVTIGLGIEGLPRSALGEVSEQFGWLAHVPASGRWRPTVDLAAFEFATNPGGGPLDSNPYGLLAEPGGWVVADGGANALLRVAANGDISTLAVFPSRPQGRSTDAVPTAVAVGPDGAYYGPSSRASPSPRERRTSTGSCPARRRRSPGADSRR